VDIDTDYGNYPSNMHRQLMLTTHAVIPIVKS